MGAGHHVNHEAAPKANQDIQALKDAQIPLAWRDTCGHLLVKLNKCRRQTLYSPNQCVHERHTFEECEHNAYLQRVEAKKQVDKVMEKRKAALAAED